jgi:hypothetical protein
MAAAPRACASPACERRGSVKLFGSWTAMRSPSRKKSSLGLWARAEILLQSLLRPWNAYQVVIVLGLIPLAHPLRAWLGPVCRDWMRRREGWPKWRMRLLVMLHRRLRLVFFVLLTWPTV